MVTEQIIPALPKVIGREPAILMAILGMFFTQLSIYCHFEIAHCSELKKLLQPNSCTGLLYFQGSTN